MGHRLQLKCVIYVEVHQFLLTYIYGYSDCNNNILWIIHSLLSAEIFSNSFPCGNNCQKRPAVECSCHVLLGPNPVISGMLAVGSLRSQQIITMPGQPAWNNPLCSDTLIPNRDSHQTREMKSNLQPFSDTLEFFFRAVTKHGQNKPIWKADEGSNNGVRQWIPIYCLQITLKIPQLNSIHYGLNKCGTRALL